jgi:hypothetical protein
MLGAVTSLFRGDQVTPYALGRGVHADAMHCVRCRKPLNPVQTLVPVCLDCSRKEVRAVAKRMSATKRFLLR